MKAQRKYSRLKTFINPLILVYTLEDTLTYAHHSPVCGITIILVLQ